MLQKRSSFYACANCFDIFLVFVNILSRRFFYYVCKQNVQVGFMDKIVKKIAALNVLYLEDVT